MSTIRDNRYRLIKKIITSADRKMISEIRKKAVCLSASSEVDDFVILSSVCKIEVEIVHLHPNELVSLPVSEFGQTTVHYSGKAPIASYIPDEFGNLELRIPAGCAVEVIFNRSKPGAQGRNRGSHAKKIIYVANMI